MRGILGCLLTRRVKPHLLQVSRCLSYHAPHFRPRSVLSANRLFELAISASPRCLMTKITITTSSGHIRVQRYSQKSSNVFNITENVDMLRKRISFSGGPNTTAQILPIGLITPEAGDEKDLKIVIVPLNLAGMDANSLKETLEAINQLRMYAHHIQAFSSTMVDDYNALNEAFQEVESKQDQEAKQEVTAEDNAIWDDFATADAVAAPAADARLQADAPLQLQETVSCLKDTLTNAAPAPGSPPLKTSKTMSAMAQPNPQPLNRSSAVEIDLNAAVQGGDVIDEVQVDVPQDLSDRLNYMAVSSMELSFEMDMTNLREAMDSNDVNAITYQDPMICMHTKVEMEEPSEGKQTVPLRFNGLISGLVELDAQKLNLTDEQMTGFNDSLTALAANLCSTALDKGFSKDLNLNIMADDTTMITPGADVKIADQPQANFAYPLEVPAPTDKDGCKHPPVKPKRKCPGKCPLIDDPCKEDPCQRPDEKKKPPKKAESITEIIASANASFEIKDPCVKDAKDGKKEPSAKDDGKDVNELKTAIDIVAVAKDSKIEKKGKSGKSGKHGKTGKKDPCAKFKKDGKSGSKFSTLAGHHNPNKRFLSTALNQSFKDPGSNSSTMGPRFRVNSTLVRRHYRVRVPKAPESGPTQRLVGKAGTPARFVINSTILRRSYSKKKTGGGKCFQLQTKFPKSRGKDVKERTGLRGDCFKDEEGCPKQSCGSKCSKVKFPKKKCDRSNDSKGAVDRLLDQGAPVQLQSQLRSFGTRACIQQSPSHSDAPTRVPNSHAYALRISDPYKVDLVPMNKPSPRDFDVLIRTGSVAISGSDIHVYESGNRAVEAMSLGHDATGYVVEVGRCVQHLQVGDRVVVESALSCSICDLCKQGLYNMCAGLVYNGFLSTFQTHPADLCHRMHPSISMEEGALTQTLAQGCQSCFMGNIKPTSNVLILGTCPTAAAAAICAKAMGARKITIAGCIGPALDMIASDLGFDVVEFDHTSVFGEVLEVIYSKFQAWPNCVINCSISAMSMNLAVMALQPCGVCVLSECDAECASFNALDVLMKNIRLIPSFRSANMYPTALQLMESGQAPMARFITATFPLCEADQAFRCAQHESNMGLGKVIVNCAENATMDDDCRNS
ncbi:hypothetical protein KR038_007848 [Drosophila bunnanda]|nr:hypothetical protein KR038_007848 [Drosophila bunnanda]